MSASQPLSLTDEYVYRVAPDGKSAQAALELVNRGAFSGAKMSSDGTRLEAMCQGSEPYFVQIDLSKPSRPQTSCPCFSYKRPCKHAVGLLFLAARTPDVFEGAPKSTNSVDMQTTAARQAPAKKTKRPTDTGEALLQAVLADPQDDTPRLVYADWLEEYGDDKARDRAEFIRIQMELARAEKIGPREKQLRAREKQLWNTYRNDWVEELPQGQKKRILFQRGFLEELRGYRQLRRVDVVKLFAKHPIYRLRLADAVDRHLTGELAVIPQLAKVRLLILDDCSLSEPTKTLQILFGTPFLSGVTYLEMTGLEFSTLHVGILVDSPLLARLRELHLMNTTLGPAGVQKLAGSPHCAALKKLSLVNCPIGLHGARALASSPHLQTLELLDLSNTDVPANAHQSLRDRFGDRVILTAQPSDGEAK